MSDDQDGSESSPQLENEINKIKSQSYSSGPSGPHNKGAVESLTNAYGTITGIDKDLEQLEEKTKEEEQRQQAFRRSEYTNDVVQKQEAQREALQKEKDDLLARIAAANDKIYEAFSINHEKQLARKKAHTNNLSEALQATKDGKPISEELRNSLKKSDQQKKEEREHNKKLAAAIKAAKAEEERLKAAMQEIDNEIKNSSQSQEQIQALQQRRKQHADRLDVVNGEKQKGYQEIDVYLTQAEAIDNGRKASKSDEDKALWLEQGKDIVRGTLAVIGPNVLYDRAKEKSGGKAEAVLALMEDPEILQAIFLDATQEAIQQDPKTAEKLKEILGQNIQITDSSLPKIPPNTPNVNTTLPNKGKEGPGK